MKGRCGRVGWVTGLVAGFGVVAAATAGARASLATVLALPPANAGTLADGGGQRERVIEAVQRRFNARVVRVTETSVNGRAALELRLLSDQRVWNLVVDAQTGQVLSGA